MHIVNYKSFNYGVDKCNKSNVKRKYLYVFRENVVFSSLKYEYQTVYL